MYTKQHLLVAKIASKSFIKPELACIAYYGDKVIATDTFRMLEIPVEDGVALAEPDLRLASSAKMPVGFLKVDEPLGVKPRSAGKFPDTTFVTKKMSEGEFITLKVNGKLFGELLTQMSKLNKYGTVTMRVPIVELETANRAILLEAPMGDINKGLKATGLMMPIHN